MFSKIDPILASVAKQHGLHWVHRYRDEEVRSTEVTFGASKFAQLWIEAGSEPGEFIVRAWDRKRT